MKKTQQKILPDLEVNINASKYTSIEFLGKTFYCGKYISTFFHYEVQQHNVDYSTIILLDFSNIDITLTRNNEIIT